MQNIRIKVFVLMSVSLLTTMLAGLIEHAALFVLSLCSLMSSAALLLIVERQHVLEQAVDESIRENNKTHLRLISGGRVTVMSDTVIVADTVLNALLRLLPTVTAMSLLQTVLRGYHIPLHMRLIVVYAPNELPPNVPWETLPLRFTQPKERIRPPD